MQTLKASAHLTDGELYGLAIPPAGVPEALPAHLSDCLACSHALQEWKAAVRDLAADVGPIGRRSSEEWVAAEEKTIQAIRRARFAARPLPMRWAVGIAASLLLFALAAPLRRSADRVTGGSSEMSAQDKADDALLRDVARLSRGEDGGSDWNTLVPDPGTGTRPEESL